MDKRKKFIPRRVSGYFWAPFFDPKIQDVLESRKNISDIAFCDTQDHLLAWPIAVYEATRWLAGAEAGDHVDYIEDFSHCFALDQEFSAALLLALSVYFNNQSPSANRLFRERDDPFFAGRKSNWQDIALIISGRDSKVFAARIAKIGAKEVSSVQKMFSEWKPHFDAADRLELNLKSKPSPTIIQNYCFGIIPQQDFKNRFHSPKVKNK